MLAVTSMVGRNGSSFTNLNVRVHKLFWIFSTRTKIKQTYLKTHILYLHNIKPEFLMFVKSGPNTPRVRIQLYHTCLLSGLNKKFDQFGSVCMKLNSNNSLKQSLKMSKHICQI